ncbi:CLUMA_CG010750, isoform A [Clunio marinus]|uniref:CLUMA_CG010750, isoform A n=1 Tax=Clunio marinus TaxID=568069 RepID=A0A1J1IAP9_9DIPT|nr:CLUMA_CG010750, isoform A [Clunio marinus]
MFLTTSGVQCINEFLKLLLSLPSDCNHFRKPVIDAQASAVNSRKGARINKDQHTAKSHKGNKFEELVVDEVESDCVFRRLTRVLI